MKWNLFPGLSEMMDHMAPGRDFAYRSNCVPQPSANIMESEEGFRIDMALPGRDKKEIEIKLEKNILTISSSADKNEGDGYTRREFWAGPFCRSFMLSDRIDAEGIRAGYQDGILSIHLPKHEKDRKPLKREISVA
ncbi:MAG: Hsp20/alpha crystallin family protein [Bacteroidales bacterium]|nr:Hsp20/alpha crystallin family protein [Bacteroidales bacterium]